MSAKTQTRRTLRDNQITRLRLLAARSTVPTLVPRPPPMSTFDLHTQIVAPSDCSHGPCHSEDFFECLEEVPVDPVSHSYSCVGCADTLGPQGVHMPVNSEPPMEHHQRGPIDFGSSIALQQPVNPCPSCHLSPAFLVETPYPDAFVDAEDDSEDFQDPDDPLDLDFHIADAQQLLSDTQAQIEAWRLDRSGFLLHQEDLRPTQIIMIPDPQHHVEVADESCMRARVHFRLGHVLDACQHYRAACAHFDIATVLSAAGLPAVPHGNPRHLQGDNYHRTVSGRAYLALSLPGDQLDLVPPPNIVWLRHVPAPCPHVFPQLYQLPGYGRHITDHNDIPFLDPWHSQQLFLQHQAYALSAVRIARAAHLLATNNHLDHHYALPIHPYCILPTQPLDGNLRYPVRLVVEGIAHPPHYVRLKPGIMLTLAQH